MIGIAKAAILLGQDFLGEFCAPEDGEISKEKKQMALKINTAIIPWLQVLGKITTRKDLARVAALRTEIQDNQIKEGDGVVYVRMILEGNGEYVGIGLIATTQPPGSMQKEDVNIAEIINDIKNI